MEYHKIRCSCGSIIAEGSKVVNQNSEVKLDDKEHGIIKIKCRKCGCMNTLTLKPRHSGYSFQERISHNLHRKNKDEDLS